MKCISLWQPWASLVAIGAKTIETRSWEANYSGPLAIHAAKKWDRSLAALMQTEPFASVLAQAGIHSKSDLRFGEVLGYTRLYVCSRIYKEGIGWLPIDQCVDGPLPPEPERSFGDYTPGRYAWILGGFWKLSKPLPFRGSQRFFDVPDACLSSIGGAP